MVPGLVKLSLGGAGKQTPRVDDVVAAAVGLEPGPLVDVSMNWTAKSGTADDATAVADDVHEGGMVWVLLRRRRCRRPVSAP